jgi:predicted NBD/HSP70 family sugar kinase
MRPSSELNSPPLPLTSAPRPVSEGGRRVLDLILKSGGLSQAAITRGLDLAQPTVTRLLQGFQADKMVLMNARRADRVGHPSAHVSLNPDFAYALGVGMLGDMVSMTLTDFSGQSRGQRRICMPDMSEGRVIERLVECKAALLAESKIDPRRLIGAGVGLSGFFVGEGRWMNPPAALEDWALRDIEPVLEQALGVPVMVDNDGNVGAIGESLFGVGRRSEHFAYLHLSNGFGGGLISDGKPIRGLHGNAGEFGGVWMLCCKTYPNLELLRECVGARGHRFATVEEMVQVIDSGTAGVSDWLEQAVPAFALLSGILAYTLDPQLIVIGGRLPRSIAEALAARISVAATPPRRDRGVPLPAVVVSEVPSEPVAAGAAALALKKAFFV